MIKNLRNLVKATLTLTTEHWSDASRLFPIHDQASWAITWEMKELATIARRLNIKTCSPLWYHLSKNQALFLGSQFFLLSDFWFNLPHKIGTAYFHGKPGTGIQEFDTLFNTIRKKHHKLSRIQVSHSEMRHLILETGIAEHKVFQIPIGINLDYFPINTDESRKAVRDQLGIPQSAVVIGSFQKDGNGHGKGLTPKLIKGPDIFLKTLEIVRQKIPELYVFLTGPARGYVIKGLEQLKIPYTHTLVEDYANIGRLYHALDLYMVTSRQEGGPKAVLESMATGVPLVTTRVGQAMDLVKHQTNAWMTDSEDIEALAHWAEWVLLNPSSAKKVIEPALKTAKENSYLGLTDKWNDLLTGFVNPSN